MPTPFMHLVMADAMLAQPGLPDALRERLTAGRPAFRFGHTAPDAQTVSGQSRESTHFFSVPMTSRRAAQEIMFERHADLARPAGLDPARAAFLTGYLCHLLLDQLWIAEIFQPIFGERAAWGTFPERLYLHNVLRAYLDRRDLPRLANGVRDSLCAAKPANWLPFIDDRHLRRWRDLVADQLAPGASARTIEIFARRMDRDPHDFEALLASPEELDRQVFSRIPLERIAAFRVEGLARSLELTRKYWRD
ncbi:MAG: zinc dependent phospholipase C family protein [Chloroflexi bacterium]|nr:zinc dependent phospholipase C family protein [Chloroflexota bacterium]